MFFIVIILKGRLKYFVDVYLRFNPSLRSSANLITVSVCNVGRNFAFDSLSIVPHSSFFAPLLVYGAYRLDAGKNGQTKK